MIGVTTIDKPGHRSIRSSRSIDTTKTPVARTRHSAQKRHLVPPPLSKLGRYVPSPRVQRLVEPFIKLEDRARQYQPQFESMSRWPKINLNPGSSHFTSRFY